MSSVPGSNSIIIYGDSISNRGGTGVYVKRLLDGFTQLQVNSVGVALSSSGICTPAEALVSKSDASGLRKLYSENFALPRIAGRCKPDLVHLPAFGGRPPLGVPYVVTLHDLAFLAHPEMFPKLKSFYYKHHFRKTAENAAIIMVDSEFTAGEAEKYLNVSRNRIRTVYLSTPSFNSNPAFFREKYGIFEDYLLFTGTVEPRKNVDLLLDAWKTISRNRPDLRLVITGRWGWGDVSLRDRLENAKGVILTGSISDSILRSCVSGAELLIYPSLYEGFGLPPLEAASAGVKSVIGTAGVLTEVFGGIAEQMKENTSSALIEAVEIALSEKTDKEKLIAFASRFTNRILAENVYSVYREVAG